MSPAHAPDSPGECPDNGAAHTNDTHDTQAPVTRLVRRIERHYHCRALSARITGTRWAFDHHDAHTDIDVGIPHRIVLSARRGVVVYTATPLSDTDIRTIRRWYEEFADGHHE